MAENPSAYEEAMREGSTHASQEQWVEAIAAYQRALVALPDDPKALMALGLACLAANRPEESLAALQRAARIDRANPTAVEHIAEILEQMGRFQEASRAYLEAAERHGRRNAPTLALRRLEDAVRVDPNSVQAHIQLLRAYLALRKHQQAMSEYLALATIYYSKGQNGQALEICRHALKLDPQNLQIQVLMNQLLHGEETTPLDRTAFGADYEEQMADLEEGGSPAEAARQKALAELAETVFSDVPPQTGTLVMRPLSKREVDAMISKSLDAQTRGDIEEAIRGYERVLEAGIIQTAVNFNLGLLYQQQMRFEDALSQFQQSVRDPEYRLGSHFAMGECYRALGRIEEALTHFLEVLKIVDLGTVDRSQADNLIQLYEELALTHAAKGEREQATEFVNTLITFLSDKGWEDKVSRAREMLDTLTHEGPVLSLAEILAVPGSERILQAIGLAQEYQRRGLGYSALDELDRAISLAPTFLPLHWQMAETLVSMGRTDEAVAKFLSIADVYRVRGNFAQSVAMYERALRLAPLNVSVRVRLIDLLISHGEIDKALEHYLALGEAYYQMAQLDRAREQYNVGLQLAPRGSRERNWAVKFLHRIGDIDMQRVDWRRAISVYEQIRDLAPEDEKARLTLMDLYYRFNQPQRAIAELDHLMRAYRKAGLTKKMLTILEEQAAERPNSIPIRTWLAQAHLDARNIPEALQHLDVLGDLQLQAGKTQDAIATVQTILLLNPPNAEAYRQLLEQLSRGA